ncbi:hypothetical protein T03_4779 [Trichinella britovi]|uniref:Uncharacterized protein n=1 Tax=Trichinella britovi TaxID=45882 RepID=A0A0V0YUY3_TRIBR|nr:hypothetical protein T03_4779 [Trichinella britovi]
MYEVGKKAARLMLWWKELDMWFTNRLFSLSAFVDMPVATTSL